MVLYGRLVNEMAKKISEEDYKMIEARRNLQKGIFIPESVKTLHNMKGLEEKIGCYDSYVYAERLLEYICKNKTAIASHEIELMFYTMIAYTYADINRGELISRLKTYYKTAVWNMAGDAGEKIEKDMTGFKDIFNIRFDDVGQHDIYDWFDNLCHLLIIVRKMCDCIVTEYEEV